MRCCSRVETSSVRAVEPVTETSTSLSSDGLREDVLAEPLQQLRGLRVLRRTWSA